MKFLRISLLLCAISFAFLAKAQEISPSFYKYHPLPPTPDTFVATEMITIPDGIQSITKDEKTGQVIVTDTGVESSDFLEKTTTIDKELKDVVEEETNAIKQEADYSDTSDPPIPLMI